MPNDLFLLAIKDAGLIPPQNVVADGLMHRFSTTGKTSDTAGWYVLHDDGLAAGVFGCWRTGLTVTWCAKPDHSMTHVERDILRRRVQEAKRQRDAEAQLRRQQAQAVAIARWDAALPVAQHPYLTDKGVEGYGLRAEGSMLLVPMRDTAGAVQSLQTIAPNGRKLFLAGGRVRGCYYSVGCPGAALVVCEGVATAHSVRAATDLAVAAAFSANNLAPVAQALRQKFPALPIILAADDDHATEGNPGLTAARAAALAVGGLVAMPQFPADRPRGATDFNDLHQQVGADAVRARFAEVLEEFNHASH